MKWFTTTLLLLLATLLSAQTGALFTDDLVFGAISVNGSDNPTLHSGDSVMFTISVRNVGTEPFQDCRLHIATTDPYVTLLDSTEYFDYIAPGNEYTLHNCASCLLSHNIPDGHLITFSFLITNDSESALVYRSYCIRSGSLSVVGYRIYDNGNRDRLVNVAETDPIVFTLRNEDNRTQYGLTFTAETSEPGIQVISSPMGKDTLFEEETFLFPVVVTASSPFTDGTTFDVRINVAASDGQGNSTSVGSYVVSIIGEANCERFADGQFPQIMYGEPTQVGWHIDPTDAYSDTYCLRSGVISHYDSSSVNLPVAIHINSSVSFACKTSSEINYDWLYFYIDGTMKGRWSGINDWTEVSFPILPGVHVLTWRYIKDRSVNTGSDCAWIDDICFSNYNDGLPSLAISPDSIGIVLADNDAPVFERTLHFSNESDKYLLFENELCDEANHPIAWVSIAETNGSLNAHQQRDLTLKFNTTGYLSGDYSATLRVHVCDVDTVIRIPIVMRKQVGIEERRPYRAESPAVCFPNPTTGGIQVRHETLALRQVRVTDVCARTLETLLCEGNLCTVDLSALPRGVYLLNILFETGGTQIIKVVKQ